MHLVCHNHAYQLHEWHGSLFGAGRACADVLKTDDEECYALNEEVDVASFVCVKHVIAATYNYAGSNKNL